MKKLRDSIPQGLRFDVFRRDRFTCQYCGRSSPSVVLHCDHVKPRSKQGETSMENLITACTDCNYGKRAKEDVQPPTASPDNGMVGLFGYTYDGDGLIEYQFKIKRVHGDICLVQLFAWTDGRTMELKSFTVDYLLSDKCKLFEDKEAWFEENQKNDREIDRRERLLAIEENREPVLSHAIN